MERQRASKVKESPAHANHLQKQSARQSAHPLMELQRSIGNQAVQRLINSPYIQAKLAVSTPGDPFEQEADGVADSVMRMENPGTTRALGRAEVPAPSSVDQTLAGPGKPLDTALRQDMEQRFGHEFSGVRVHSGGAAEQSAQDVNAQAYTVGNNIVFGPGRFAPETVEGRRLIAHELTHVVQQSAFGGIQVQRTPAAPVAGNDSVPFDRSKVDISSIPDVSLHDEFGRFNALFKTASVAFVDPAIKSCSLTLYNPSDATLSNSITNPIPAGGLVLPLFSSLAGLMQGRYTLRAVGFDVVGQPVAYADRSFFVWTSKPTGKPPDIAALESEKGALEAITKAGSGKSFGEVAGAFAKLKDVTHDLAILETGTGPFVGSDCPLKPPGAEVFGCTNVVLKVLGETFTQQGRQADWAKVLKKIATNKKTHGSLEGWDIQAALQTEVGWKGIFWAPDPAYEVPREHLSKARPDEAGYAAYKARRNRVYKESGRPSVSIHHSVTNYSPEAPNVGYGAASTTVKDTSQLDKLKKLPFGVLSAHGAYHMAFITYGKVVEVHWDKEATDINLIEQTDFDKWAIGPLSGYHYFASGAIVAPAEDVDAAFK